jgi:hypothetical protein
MAAPLPEIMDTLAAVIRVPTEQETWKRFPSLLPVPCQHEAAVRSIYTSAYVTREQKAPLSSHECSSLPLLLAYLHRREIV